MAFYDDYFKMADAVGSGAMSQKEGVMSMGGMDFPDMTGTNLPPDSAGGTGGYANRRPGQRYIDQIQAGWRQGRGAFDPVSISKSWGQPAWKDVRDWYTSTGSGLQKQAQSAWNAANPPQDSAVGPPDETLPPKPTYNEIIEANKLAHSQQGIATDVQGKVIGDQYNDGSRGWVPEDTQPEPVAKGWVPQDSAVGNGGQPSGSQPPPTDPLGNAAASGDPPPEGYAGDVFDYAPPENPLMPQLEDAFQSILDLMSGKSVPPEMESIMANLGNRQAQELDYFTAGQRMRGITNSTPGMEERNRMLQSQRAEEAQNRLGITQQVISSQLPALQQIYAQGASSRAQSLDSFNQFVDRQFRSDAYQDTRRREAINSMLSALGISMPPIQMPNLSIPASQPGFMESLAALFGNAMMTPGFSETPLGSWLP
jgi:hypothetical protein